MRDLLARVAAVGLGVAIAACGVIVARDLIRDAFVEVFDGTTGPGD